MKNEKKIAENERKSKMKNQKWKKIAENETKIKRMEKEVREIEKSWAKYRESGRRILDFAPLENGPFFVR